MPYLRVKNELPIIPGYSEGAIAYAPDAADAPLNECICYINPEQSGSGDPSPSNVRPITGHTELNLVHTGANIWDEEWELGAINTTNGQNVSSSTTIRSKNYIPCIPSTPYYRNSPQNIIPFFYDNNKDFISFGGWGKNNVITTPNNAYYIRFYVDPAYGTTYNHDISINYPSTDTSYHAYTGTTTTTDLGTTVYGGTLDVVSGVLTIDRAIVDLGEWNYTYNSTHGFFYTNMPSDSADNIIGGRTGVCSCYKLYQGNFNGFKDTDMSFTYNNSSIGGAKTIGIRDTTTTDASVLKTNLTGQKLIYELATPITIQLTPQEVKSLLGVNNFYHDCNGDTKITYIRRLDS